MKLRALAALLATSTVVASPCSAYELIERYWNVDAVMGLEYYVIYRCNDGRIIKYDVADGRNPDYAEPMKDCAEGPYAEDQAQQGPR